MKACSPSASFGLPRLALVLLVLLLFQATVGCRERTPRIAQLPPGAVILAFGDSLTSGYGAGSRESYPAVLEQLTGFNVINAGVPGEITGQGLKRLPALLYRYQPDLVILCHGGNDLLRHHDLETTAGNLRQMILAARASGAQVLLVGVPQPGLLLRPAAFYEELAAEFEIPCEKKILHDILTNNSEKSDTIHPNAAGYRRLAEALARFIETRDSG
jgi:lysophospholipase L1-like esterase